MVHMGNFCFKMLQILPRESSVSQTIRVGEAEKENNLDLLSLIM